MAKGSLKPRQFAKAAERCVQQYDPRCPPYAKSQGKYARIQYTRSPPGAWVLTWVWVPNEAAELERASE